MRPTVPRSSCGRRRAAATLVALGSLAAAPPAAAQVTRTLTACTPDALAVCAELRLTAGPSLFTIGLRDLGATGAPGTPVSAYNLVFGTGATAAATPVTTDLAPVAVGGATVTDASPWEVFDTGDALFLSALSNRGVGGCVAGADVGGFGQAARTCGTGQFVTFSFAPTRTFNPALFQLTDLEAVALTAALPAASCGGEGVACRITADAITPGTPSTTTPEPATLALVGTGLLLAASTAGTMRRRS